MRPPSLDQLDTLTRQAMEADDWNTVADLEHRVDRAEAAERRSPDLLSSALWYASVGLQVFPLQPGAKLPHRGTHGCKDATTDHDQIVAWWEQWPDSNIGLATGHKVDVVDIDGVKGQQQRARQWCSVETCEGNQHCVDHELGLFGHIDADALAKVLTPRPGGMHIYVPAQGDGNAAGIVPGVDYRGVGGYVVAPPSVITTGEHQGRYQFLGTPKLGA